MTKTGITLIDTLGEKLAGIREQDLYHPSNPIEPNTGEREIGVVPHNLRALWSLAMLMLGESQIVVTKAGMTGKKDEMAKAVLESERLALESQLLTDLFWNELMAQFAGTDSRVYTTEKVGFREGWKVVLIPTALATLQTHLLDHLFKIIGQDMPGAPARQPDGKEGSDDPDR
ncbi:MAG: hypothetical protein V1895_01765 [Parcubacteria group bacterium]